MKTLEALPFAILLGVAGAFVCAALLLLVGYGWSTALIAAAAGSIAGYAAGLNALGERKLPPSASFAEYIAKDDRH